MNAAQGFAVIDTETTGILPGYRHRIAEIAVVQLDSRGDVTGEWSTLVNPGRDLGPQAIHGIRAVDVRRAPRFEQIAGDFVESVRGRVVVAHNWQFDAMHLDAEFDRMGLANPFHSRAGLCTMRAAGFAVPGSGRSLIECCSAIGLTDLQWHTARDDAMAAALLLRDMLARYPTSVRVTKEHLDTASWEWPNLPRELVSTVHRTPVGHVEPHFLARLVGRLPHDDEPEVDAYFAMLDDALLDRQISASEADALLEVAHELGMDKAQALATHHTYLRDLARAAWADGVATREERRDLETVAIALGLDPGEVESVLAEERTSDAPTTSSAGLVLRPGDRIVLTGDMKLARAEIVGRATAAGLRVTGTPSSKTRVVAAADPDSLSGKAKKARQLGVPIVGEDFFLRALDDLSLPN
ncbi:hypothetical protein LWP59_27235 [Amycolatopsis acidiphila]|uniref:Exonuclease domain-containing protein n=1 Tax=Amycolatopsis acidiphila TaxID=715473 RepID=A0A558AID9_9PSEU|nr:exonuclease domain-containing protein [Amycolatopsis acidiphila]TVT24035.1 hypothetical protein FNH06_07440 [Amycolatopsis acidiphila]UIJ57819.1 hypothetical protein LWP59_27235 [Amycolatopsis acidiphila]GHG87850.1 hypothetical protein GCM10017788_61860 [Amycolatopsis acidiphila]